MLTPQFFRVPMVPTGSPMVAIRFFRDRLACKTCNPLTVCFSHLLAATYALTQQHHRAPRELPTRLRERG